VTDGRFVRRRSRGMTGGWPSIPAVVLAVAVVAGCGGGGGVEEPTPTPDTFTVVAVGDIAQCDGVAPAASNAAKTAALVNAGDAVVLTLGDNAYPSGAPADFMNCFDPTWGVHKDRIRPALGNHDYVTPAAAGYFGYFGAAAGPDRRGYYSFDYGGWHFLSLNSEIDATVGSAQYAWLVADLDASRNTLCTLAYWHQPVFSSGIVHGGSPKMRATLEALYDAGVDVVLTGHEHLYERFAPQTAAGTADAQRGIRHFVAGTGGAGLYTFGAPVSNSEARYDKSHGVLRLELSAGAYRWEFLPVGGGTPVDSGSDACHR
jgi:hypothetical protein